MISTYQRLKDNLEYLKLKKASESLDEVIDFITANELSFTEGLLRLTDVEMDHRKTNLIKAMVKVGAFPFIKEVKDFDFDFQPSVNKAQILEFESLGFIDKKENIVFLGPSGVGKTHLLNNMVKSFLQFNDAKGSFELIEDVWGETGEFFSKVVSVSSIIS